MSSASLLTDAHVAQFMRDGFCVVENVVDAAGVEQLRRDFHRFLRDRVGINHHKMDADQVPSLMRQSSAVSQGCPNVFYSPWKLDAFYNDTVMALVAELFRHTFASGEVEGFEHHFGAFDPTHALAFCDRAAYRVPNVAGGLPLHVDMNCYDENSYTEFWRPIQMSLALTDHVNAASGGIGFTPGWHTRIVERCRGLKNKGRQFNILNETDFADVHADRVICRQPAGSLCIWDNRLPHFVSSRFDGPDTREVLFATFLPDVAMNRVYAQRQLTNMLANVSPPDYKKATADFDARFRMSELQRRLFGLAQWDNNEDDDNDRE